MKSFKGASLFGTDFRRAILKGVSFVAADWDTETNWSEGFGLKSVGLTPWLKG